MGWLEKLHMEAPAMFLVAFCSDILVFEDAPILLSDCGGWLEPPS